jgi:hypothetical protein
MTDATRKWSVYIAKANGKNTRNRENETFFNEGPVNALYAV